MKYFNAKIIRRIKTDKEDELGNPIYEHPESDIKNCRTTEWTSEDVNIYGRDLTSGSRKVITRPFRGSIDDVVKIKIGKSEYNIERIVDLGRWILFIVRGFRI